jgi:hypothetical protein
MISQSIILLHYSSFYPNTWQVGLKITERSGPGNLSVQGLLTRITEIPAATESIQERNDYMANRRKQPAKG